jgi:anti-anti-sigma factor
MAANPVNPISELYIDAESAPTQTVFRCSGRINSSTAQSLREQVRREIEQKKNIVLDLSGVSHLDSFGAGDAGGAVDFGAESGM